MSTDTGFGHHAGTADDSRLIEHVFDDRIGASAGPGRAPSAECVDVLGRETVKITHLRDPFTEAAIACRSDAASLRSRASALELEQPAPQNPPTSAEHLSRRLEALPGGRSAAA